MTSPLEALHPARRVERVLVAGERCPPGLVPAGATAAREEVDLAVIAPSAAELRRPGWLDRAAGAAVAALSDDGLAYALLPRRARAGARGRLERAGLVVASRLVHLPARGLPRYLVPLAAGPWQYALTRQMSARGRSRRALAALLAAPLGGALLNAALPTVGVVARRPGARPLAAWVERLAGRPVAHATVATSWRGPAGPIVLACFADADRHPWGVAKLAATADREARMLASLGSAAGRAGARVPQLLGAGEAVVVETPVAGRTAAELLSGQPARFMPIATAISRWLRRWNAATRRPGESRAAADTVLSAAEALADVLPDGAAYRAWLVRRCDALGREGIDLVARHNDLTMWNVTVDEHGILGIFDWAEADELGLPLTDFFYAVADAAAAADRYRSRLDAVRACFAAGGRHAGAVAALQRPLHESLELTPAAAELAFHVCWLHHALNERHADQGSDRPFLEIARWAAARAVADG